MAGYSARRWHDPSGETSRRQVKENGYTRLSGDSKWKNSRRTNALVKIDGHNAIAGAAYANLTEFCFWLILQQRNAKEQADVRVC